jgi:hypothetical protein
MKLHQLFFTFLLLLAAFQFCFSQEAPKAVLFDKFGRVGNDELQAHIDPFYSSVRDTNSKGYIIVYGTKDDQLTKYIFERHIKGCFRYRKLPDEIFIFALGEDRNKFETELWQVPDGAEKPLFTETPRDYKISKLTEPRMISILSSDDDYCPLGFDMEFYSKFLKANSYINGKIIIREKTYKDYQKEKQKYLLELIETNKVSVRQIKIVRGKYNGASDAEFWYVPKKRK